MMKKLLLLCTLLLSVVINAQQDYYDDVNLTLTGLDLKNELATKIINTHTNLLSYTPGIWEACKATDVDPNNNNEVLLIYGYSASGITSRSRGINDNGGNNGQWNREHTYAKSLGNPNLGTSGPGADAHHLRASDVQYNNQRSSKKFATGSGNSGDVTGGWYPGDEWKGDVARMMMYMYLRYGNQCLPTGVGVGDSSGTPDDMIDLFLKWNAEDPVSQIEDNRNTFHENTSNTYAQGNRNPFIDNPNLATQIWGGDIAENRWDSSTPDDTETPTIPTALSTSDITSNSITVSWNPSSDNVGVIAYEVFVDGISNITTGGTSIVINGLEASTNYSFTVRAKDAAGNTSAQSSSTEATTLEDTSIDACVFESFTNIGTASSSYSSRNWTGDNGFEWTASDARTDQTLTSGNNAITIRNGELSTVQTIEEGISSFSVKTKRVFTGGSGTFDLNVNDSKVGEITYSDVEKTTIINDINISGNVTITITNKTSTTDRVIFDDLQWECYNATAGIEELSRLNSIKIYPNPSLNGKITLQTLSNIEVENIKIYSILGKKVIDVKYPNFINNKYTLENLKSGIYLIKLSNKKQSTTKKLVIQ
ncbi:putative secreted protein (Por secretion system target) [Tenacibaculum adriaticum]|uniref:Putative secreted protein (Por secretion system target) n=1 Tax=Tenacibaculum adriaticum TaxID=413713 RepID=A0A5S5DVR6_9FLAO|nr:endonuclease [Tenacibaculum adriaticum]TYP99136.1 putative secreted protein (Por secretion system target) [Tenacibaculum adriaticum]